jgi:hypothetical protein
MTDSTRFLKDEKTVDALQAIFEFGTFLLHVLHLLFDRGSLVFRLGKITLDDQKRLAD